MTDADLPVLYLIWDSVHVFSLTTVHDLDGFTVEKSCSVADRFGLPMCNYCFHI